MPMYNVATRCIYGTLARLTEALSMPGIHRDTFRCQEIGLPQSGSAAKHTRRRRWRALTERHALGQRILFLTLFAAVIGLHQLASQSPAPGQDPPGAADSSPQLAQEEPEPLPEDPSQLPEDPSRLPDTLEDFPIDQPLVDDVTERPLPDDPRPLPEERPANNDEGQASQRLNVGDAFSVRFHGRPELSSPEMVISPDGTVSYLQAKEIEVAGLTIPEIRERLETRLSEFHQNPQLMVSPVALGSRRYTILGMVPNNGVFPLTRKLRLLEALALSGGINATTIENATPEMASDFSRCFLLRGEQKLDIDFEKLYLQGDLSQNVTLQNGDYIYIASNARNKCYALGSVGRISALTVTPNLTLMGVITSAGGYHPNAWKGKVMIVRGSLSQPKVMVINTRDILNGKSRDVPVEAGDLIYVHDRPFLLGEQLLDTVIRAFIRGAVSGLIDDNVGVGI